MHTYIHKYRHDIDLQVAGRTGAPAPAWKLQLSEWRQELGMPDSVKLWSPHMSYQTSERCQAILDTVAVEKLGLGAVSMSFEERKARLRNVYVDLSQNPKFRSRTNDKGITGCLSTSTLLYSYGRDSVLLPYELLLLQGHSRSLKIPATVNSAQVKTLAGEGISCPCLGTVLWAIYLTNGFP